MLLAQAASAGCAPGIYAPDAAIPITEQPAQKRKLANLAGAVFLSPFAAGKAKVKTVIPGATAATRVGQRRPVFRFCFAPQHAGSGYVGTDAAPSAPSDYRLVRLSVNGEQRELELAAVGGLGGNNTSLAKSVIPVDVVENGGGIYLVKPRIELSPGEYCFLRLTGGRLASTRKKDINERVADFAID